MLDSHSKGMGCIMGKPIKVARECITIANALAVGRRVCAGQLKLTR